MSTCSGCGGNGSGCCEKTIITKEGRRGLQGDPGPAGPLGPQGTSGAQGLAGTDGLVGPQGIQGEQGDPGPQGDEGPGGVATSLDYGSAVKTTTSPAATIFDIGWNGSQAGITANVTRDQFGDLNGFSGTFQWTGTWDGIGSQTCWIEFGGAALASGPEHSMTMIVTQGDNFIPARVEIANVLGTKYLKVEMSNSDVIIGAATYVLKISGLTFYS